MNLAAAQALFWESVRQPASEAACAAIRPAGQLSAAEAWDVYRTAYWVRQVAALEELFPRTQAGLGADAFSRHAALYVRATPSTFHALEDYARGFPATLPGPWADVAAVEQARLDALTAPDQPIAAAPPPVLRLAASVHFATVSEAAAQALALSGPTAWRAEGALAIWRQGMEVFERWIPADELAHAQACRPGRSLPTFCERFDGPAEDVATRVTGLLRAWLGRAWVVQP